jgi:hypothetical protein
MTNQYKVLKDKQSKEFNDFPISFAFSDKQFKEGMERLGLTENDTDKVYSIGGGGFIRKSDSKKFSEMLNKQDEEMRIAIEQDTTGEGFIYDMFRYELANHEYGYTFELDDTLRALGLTFEKVESNEKLLNGLMKAKMLFVD